MFERRRSSGGHQQHGSFYHATATIGNEDGLHLTEEEKNAVIDRILKANNPNVASTPVYFDYKKDARVYKFVPTVDHVAVHLALDGNTIRKDSEEADRLEAERARRLEELEAAERAERNPELVETEKISTKILKNQFNYSDRASQTVNQPMRERLVITDPPPSITLSNAATQWEMYDAYEEERLANERAQAAGRRKGGREEDKSRPSREARTAEPEDIFNSASYTHALRVVERMVNQNDSYDIVDDYKYWEDESDQFKEDGNLLPLWKFITERVKRKEVTCVSWHPAYTDMFAVGYGSYDFLKQGVGMIQCFTLKNAFPTGPQGTMPAYPEFVMQLDSGVMCLAFHPVEPAYLACGLYDGSVCVFDLRQKSPDNRMRPIYQSTVKTGKHTDPVWEVYWSKAADTLQFFSISSDGRTTAWTVAKNELQHADVMKLAMSDSPGGDGVASPTAQSTALVAEGGAEPEAALVGLAGGTCFDFSRTDENIFVVGTEEGHLRRCSKAYNAQYLDTYEGHSMAVYAVRWNEFHQDIFLTCSADWTVKLWIKSSPRPLMSFDLGSAVGDVAWAPYSSTVFAAVTADGKVHVFDLNKNKNEPLCAQAVVKNAKLNHLAFNPKEPIVLVGDARGTVLSLKLSPNLRQKPPVVKGETATPRELEIRKLERLISITLKDRELLEDN